MKIAINGFGRLGRNICKIALERPGIDIVAINDLAEPAILAHILKHDSTYGVYNREVTVKNNNILVDEIEIPVYSILKPAELSWSGLDVDIVIESTGMYLTAEGKTGGYMDHVTKAGAGKVILTASALDAIETCIPGVNDADLADKTDTVTAMSMACSAGNCLGLMLQVLNRKFGVKQGFYTDIHAISTGNAMLDSPHSNFRMARSAMLNIAPVNSEAAESISLVLPELMGKIKGMGMSVPIPVGSAVDLVVQLDSDVERDDVNTVFQKAAENDMQGLIEYSPAPLVSSDIKGNSHSCILDSSYTLSISPGFVKILGWFDNEFGYASRIVDLIHKLG